MKIAYIVLKGMPLGGGIEKYTEELGSRLAARGHEIIVYAMRHYGVSDGYHNGMKIKTAPSIKTKNLEKLTASASAILKHCMEDDVDIVHYHALGPSMFCFLPRLLGRKVVVQGHGLEWKRSKWGAIGRLFLRLTEIPSVRFPHAVTVVSEVQKKYLMDKYGIDSVHIPTGVALPRLEEPDIIKGYGLQGGDYILFAARLTREKGAHYLIEAFKRITTDMKLVIAGDSMHEDSYKAELHRMAGENRNIIFTGHATGKLLRELFSNCRLFVLPSEVEGLSTSLLEAMSYSNCCLVSDIPENTEALGGLAYTFRNMDVDDLRDKLAYLMADAGAVDLYRERARIRALEHYSWDTIAERFEDLYAKLLS